MNKKIPLVSIIIPTFNSEKTLEKCLRSINNQKEAALETIVVDEFSRDRTPQIAKEHASLLQVKGERSVARNTGAQHAKGDYYFFIDSDMELTPRVINACMEASAGKHPVVIPEISEGTGFWAESRILERKCYTGDDFIEAARFFPKSIYKKLKGYDPEMAGVEDWDLHQRARKLGYKPKRIKEYIIHHEGSITLVSAMKKKRYYGQVFNKYRMRHPEAFRKAFVRTSFIKNWKLLASDPVHACGVFVMKGMEGLALVTGMLQGVLYGYDSKKHYR